MSLQLFFIHQPVENKNEFWILYLSPVIKIILQCPNKGRTMQEKKLTMQFR